MYSKLRSEDYTSAEFIWEIYLPGNESVPLSSETTTLVSFPFDSAPFKFTEIIIKLKAHENDFYAEAELKMQINHPPADIILDNSGECIELEFFYIIVSVEGEEDLPISFV